MPVEHGQNASHRIRSDGHVGVYEEEDFAARAADAAVTPGRGARIFGKAQDAGPRALGHGGRLVGRRVVHHDDFRIRSRGDSQSREALPEIAGIVVGRDDDRDARARRGLGWLRRREILEVFHV
jgi:hypothetical protein